MGIGEFELIARLASRLDGAGPGVRVGHGDDAAVLEVGGALLCVAVDVLVEDVHFRRATCTSADVGWKALAVNCSDLAAMGATPLAAVVGLQRPDDLPPAAVEACYDGLRQAADRWGVALVGGDTVAAPVWSLAVTALGTVERPVARPVTRAGAQPGDRVVVAGRLGASAAALRLLDRGQEPPPLLAAAYRRPQALPAAGRALAAHGATAMIDVSDGLGADLRHLCAASGARACVAADRLFVDEGTRSVLGDDWYAICGGGEDFALLATVPARQAEAAARAARIAEAVPAAVVGEVLADGPGPRVVLELPDGTALALDGAGYDHGRTVS